MSGFFFISLSGGFCLEALRCTSRLAYDALCSSSACVKHVMIYIHDIISIHEALGSSSAIH